MADNITKILHAVVLGFKKFASENLYFRHKSNQHAKVHDFYNIVQVIKLSTQKLQRYSIMVSCAISVLHECKCVL